MTKALIHYRVSATLLIVLVAVLHVSTAVAQGMLPSTRLSASGNYRITMKPITAPPPVGERHDWTLSIVRREDNQTIQPDLVRFDGGMQHHGHGLPVLPQVGDYDPETGMQVNGMQFTMAGLWQLRVLFHDGQQWDSADFQVAVGNTISSFKAGWSEQEKALLATLALPVSPRIDATNKYQNNLAAQTLGKAIFFDPRFSSGGNLSCATCHQPDKYFTDGLKLSHGVSTLSRNSPTVVGTSRQNWFYWDGRRDSAWSQAVVPLEAPDELGSNRTRIVSAVVNHYPDEYAVVFGALPSLPDDLPEDAGPLGSDPQKAAWKTIQSVDQTNINRVVTNVGKALAAYQHRLQPKPSRFDFFVTQLLQGNEQSANQVLSVQEQNGLKLFINTRTQCLNCHNSPRLTNSRFHNIGTGPDGEGLMDMGRTLGLQSALINEFNCRSQFNDADPSNCPELDSINQQELAERLRGAFKVPTLRGLARTAPYMHDGRYATLQEVMDHYVQPPAYTAMTDHEIPRLDKLTDQDVEDIIAFLLVLGEDIDADPVWLKPDKR